MHYFCNRLNLKGLPSECALPLNQPTGTDVLKEEDVTLLTTYYYACIH